MHEDVQPGWWRKDAAGDFVDEVEEIIFPDLGVDRVQVVEQEIPQIAEPFMPDLVEDSTDEEDGVDDASGGDDDEWGPAHDAPVNPVHGGVT